MCFLVLAIRHYETAIAVGLVLMGIMRFERAPPDLAFAVIMCVAAVTGRFRLRRVPALLRWVVALLLVVNLASMVDVARRRRQCGSSSSPSSRPVRAVADAVRRLPAAGARLVAVTSLAIAVISAALAALALHVHIPGAKLINGSVDGGERASGLFKDPNVFGPFLIPIALILLEQHIAPKVPRLLRTRALTTWLCLLAVVALIWAGAARSAPPRRRGMLVSLGIARRGTRRRPLQAGAQTIVSPALRSARSARSAPRAAVEGSGPRRRAAQAPAEARRGRKIARVATAGQVTADQPIGSIINRLSNLLTPTPHATT